MRLPADVPEANQAFDDALPQAVSMVTPPRRIQTGMLYPKIPRY